MTEKEKMLSGQIYDANDAALARERDRAKKLCRAYNDLSREDAEGRRALLEELLGRVGKACWIEPSFWCDYGGSIEGTSESIGSGAQRVFCPNFSV